MVEIEETTPSYRVKVCCQQTGADLDAYLEPANEDDMPSLTLVRLDSVVDAIPYYRDKVKMEGLGWTDIAPGEQGYAFKFTKQGAEEFCGRLEQCYSEPVQLN